MDSCLMLLWCKIFMTGWDSQLNLRLRNRSVHLHNQHDAEVPQGPFNPVSLFLFSCLKPGTTGILVCSGETLMTTSPLLAHWYSNMICFCRTFTFRALNRRFCPKRLTVIHTYVHTLMVVAAMQGVEQHIRSSLGFSILPKNTSTCRPGESNQWTSDNKTLALPLSHSCQNEELYPFICNDSFYLFVTSWSQ